MRGPRLKEIGAIAGVYTYDDEPSPMEVLTEHLLDLVSLQSGESTTVPPWSTVKQCIEHAQERITFIVRHLRSFGNTWPTEDYLMDELSDLPLG